MLFCCVTELDLFPEWRMSLDLYKQAPPLPSTSLWEKPLETNDGLDAAGDPHPVFPLAGGGVRVPLLDYAALKTAVRAVCRYELVTESAVTFRRNSSVQVSLNSDGDSQGGPCDSAGHRGNQTKRKGEQDQGDGPWAIF